MKKILYIIIVLLAVIHIFSAVKVSAQQLPGDPPGCFSNGDCTAAESKLKCPDCSGALESDEGTEAKNEATFSSPQESGVILPTASPSPSPSPLVEEPFSLGPFILLLIFVLVVLVIGYILFRARRDQIQQ